MTTPIRTPAPPSTILVLDADAADRRFVELGLAKTARYQIETAFSVEGALELLRGQNIDLVLTEVDLSDGDAFQLLKRIRMRPGGKDLPVLFLTKNKRASVLSAALQGGALDLITKPFQLTELLARVDAVIERQRERRQEALARSYSLAGDLATVAFPDLIHLLEIGNRDGQLFFTTDQAIGELKLQRGRVVDASFGSIQGEPAFYALMRQDRGRFEFQPGLDYVRLQRTISQTNTSLLMEGARRLDTYRREQAAMPDAASGASDPELDPRPHAAEAAAPRAMRPSAEQVADLRAVVADPFALGEIRFQNRGALIERTSSAAARERVFGLLIAPQLPGVLQFAGMASPLGEGDIASALEWDQRVLMLSLRGAHGTALDLLLLDCCFPAQVLDDLRCGTSFVIYAPPQGDHLSLPHHSLDEVVAVLGHLRPDVLVGVGNATIGACLEQLCTTAGIRPARMVVHRPIEDAHTDLRECLQGVFDLLEKPVEIAP